MDFRLQKHKKHKCVHDVSVIVLIDLCQTFFNFEEMVIFGNIMQQIMNNEFPFTKWLTMHDTALTQVT